jgi:Holliday junction resolvase-like predicted endonuclease
MRRLRKPDKLQTLINEYYAMKNLIGYTRQSRGQRLNGLIAEVLDCWDIRAKANQRSAGEIDTVFEINGIRFILEAKWEKGKVSTGSISRLQKRVKQRLAGTIGVFLSMAGYTDEAIEDIKDGERLEVILINKDHLEAFLSGCIPPEDIINMTLDSAHFEGDPYNNLFEVFNSNNQIVPLDQSIKNNVGDFFPMKAILI